MTEILDALLKALEWIQDEPFRLVAALCVGLSAIIYIFFKNEHAAYKVFAVILMVAGIGGISIKYDEDTSPVEPIINNNSDEIGRLADEEFEDRFAEYSSFCALDQQDPYNQEPFLATDGERDDILTTNLINISNSDNELKLRVRAVNEYFNYSIGNNLIYKINSGSGVILKCRVGLCLSSEEYQPTSAILVRTATNDCQSQLIDTLEQFFGLQDG